MKLQQGTLKKFSVLNQIETNGTRSGWNVTLPSLPFATLPKGKYVVIMEGHKNVTPWFGHLYLENVANNTQVSTIPWASLQRNNNIDHYFGDQHALNGGTQVQSIDVIELEEEKTTLRLNSFKRPQDDKNFCGLGVTFIRLA
jgi:hypothetical protein